MPLKVGTIVNGKWRQNCHILVNNQNEALVFDPGSEFSRVANTIDEAGWQPLAIYNTHAHYDHVGAVADLAERYKIPFYLHSSDHLLLKRANLYKMIFESTESVRQPAEVTELGACGTEITVGNFAFTWLETPGHTEGGVCYLFPEYLVTGDTLLQSGAGRTDLPGGDEAALRKSLQHLERLSGDLTILPGHGRPCALSKALDAAKPFMMEAP